jgi:hypothetical protein
MRLDSIAFLLGILSRANLRSFGLLKLHGFLFHLFLRYVGACLAESEYFMLLPLVVTGN